MKSGFKNKRIWQFLGLAAMSALVLGFFIPPEEGESGFWFSHFPALFAILGFFGCAVIIILAKWLGHAWLQRKEDYYD
jgi:hypothetical protein